MSACSEYFTEATQLDYREFREIEMCTGRAASREAASFGYAQTPPSAPFRLAPTQ